MLGAQHALLKGRAVRQRNFAQIEPEACDGCSLCVDECRFVHALDPADAARAEDGVAVPVIDPALCRGCGMCSSVCPTGAIQVRGWRGSQYDAMVDAILAVEVSR